MSSTPGAGPASAAGPQAEWETSWRVKLGNKDIRKLEAVCRLGALGYNNAIDQNLDDLIQSQGLGKASGASMLFTSNPMAVATSREMQILCLIAAIVMIAGPIQGFDPQRGLVDTPRYRHYMLQNLADRNGGANPLTPGFDEVKIMNNFEGTCYVGDAPPGVFGHLQSWPSTTHQEGPKVRPQTLSTELLDPSTLNSWPRALRP